MIRCTHCSKEQLYWGEFRQTRIGSRVVWLCRTCQRKQEAKTQAEMKQQTDQLVERIRAGMRRKEGR